MGAVESLCWRKARMPRGDGGRDGLLIDAKGVQALAIHKVAFLDVFAPEMLDEVRSQLPEGFDLVAVKTYDEREKLDVVSDADFILAGWASVPAQLLDAAPRLKLIQKWGIGYEKIDVKAAAEKGIPVAITAGANAVPVAEHTLLLMLAVSKRLPYVDHALRQGRWLKAEIRAVTYQLNGKTVGLIGFGNIGREVAKRVRAFNAHVLYYDKVRPSARIEEQLGVTFCPLDDLLARADIVSVHVPLLPKTTRLIDKRAFSLMKPSAILINASRGGVVDEGALIEALKSNRLRGAGIDVFEVEPAEANNPLFAMENVVVTPHSAGGVKDNTANMARHAFRNMLKITKGEPLDEADLIRP